MPGTSQTGLQPGQTGLGSTETCSTGIPESAPLIPLPGRASPSSQTGLGTGQARFTGIPEPVQGPVLIPVAPYAHLQQSQALEGKQSAVSAVYQV